MRQFYEEWVSFLNRQPVAGELTDSANRSPMAAELSMDEFVSLGFTHHIEIMNKVKSDLFHHQGNLPNNFSTTMQNTRNALQAIGMFKPAYLGQLSAYLRILDTEVKKPFGNISRRCPQGAALGRRPAQGNGQGELKPYFLNRKSIFPPKNAVFRLNSAFPR